MKILIRIDSSVELLNLLQALIGLGLIFVMNIYGCHGFVHNVCVFLLTVSVFCVCVICVSL